MVTSTIQAAAWIAFVLNCLYAIVMTFWIVRVRKKIKKGDNPGMMKRRPQMMYLFQWGAAFSVGGMCHTHILKDENDQMND